jgi:hypothetical protein
MSNLTEMFTAWIAERCDTSQSYRFQGKEITCMVDWSEIEKHVQATTERNLPVKGGLLPHGWYGLLMPSFAYSGQEANYIVLYPGNWKRRMYFATGKKVKPEKLDPQEVLGNVLAHESRHIKQGVRGYGLKSLLVFPGLFAAPIAFGLSLLLLPFGIAPWWLPILLLLYYGLALWAYYNDWREVDAREYAKNHGIEWRGFISIAP